jgi:hypothetical protein
MGGDLMASQEIGSLFVALGLDSAVFTAGVKRVQGVTEKLQKSFNGIADKAEAMGKRLSVVSGAMAAVGLAAGGLVKHTSDLASEIRRQSALANASTDEFQRMAAGAKRVGVDQDKLADILKDVNDRVGDFLQTGGGPMADFFEKVAPQVGVTADMFRDLSGPDALQLYVSSLEKAGLSQQEMTFYLEAMASDATALIPLLASGGAEMTRLGDAAAKSGAIMSTGLIAKSKEFSDKLATVMTALEGFRNRLAEALLPIINQFMDTIISKGIPALDSMATAIEGLAGWFGGLSQPVQEAAALIAAALGAGGPILLAVSVMARAIAALMTPMGAIGLLIAGAALIYMNWEPIKAFFVGLWDGVKSATVAAWEAVKVAISTAVTGIKRLFLDYHPAGLIYQHWDDIAAWFTATLGALPGVFRAAWDSIKAVTAQWVQDFLTIGGQIVDGLKAGIQAKWDEMVAWFSGLADSLTADFKSWFDIRSPSRVFREIGQFITEGLGLGLQDGVPQVQAAMLGVSDAVGIDGVEDGLFKFRDSARDVFSQVAFEGRKLGDVLREKLSSFASQQASNLFTSGFNGIWGALGLPTFANGTNNFAGGLAMVNERGGEIMNLPGGTQIIPHDISKRMADRSTPKPQSVDVTVYMDESTGRLGAFVDQRAGRVARAAVKTGSAAAVADHQMRKGR